MTEQKPEYEMTENTEARIVGPSSPLPGLENGPTIQHVYYTQAELKAMAHGMAYGDAPKAPHGVTAEEDYWARRIEAVKDDLSKEQLRHLAFLATHTHSFQFAINNNHTAIRGCTICGATWGTLVQGDPANLEWHPIRESEQVEG